jgi:hypothetical protein
MDETWTDAFARIVSEYFKEYYTYYKPGDKNWTQIYCEEDEPKYKRELEMIEKELERSGVE